jgi:hypothetical protein
VLVGDRHARAAEIHIGQRALIDADSVLVRGAQLSRTVGEHKLGEVVGQGGMQIVLPRRNGAASRLGILPKPLIHRATG